MKEERYHMTLDKYEHGVMINALNRLRTDQIEEHRPTEAVDDLIVKTAYAPKKNYRVIEKPCKCNHESR